jgi:hypothetical protein
MKKFVFFVALTLIIATPCFSADLTQGEKRRIGSNAEDALMEIISLWKDGKYEDLYEYGHRTDHVGLSKESFIGQMKGKSWELARSWETIRDIEADVASTTLVYVRAKVGFKRKSGGDTRFSTVTFQMILEGDRWRTSLFKILWSP